MRLRLAAVLALAFLALGVPPGGSGSATPLPPQVVPYLGDWTMTSDADPDLSGAQLKVRMSTASEAKSLVGPEWTNPSGTAYYDEYCGSSATVYAYVVVGYTWPPQGSMGGCISKEGGPHIVFAGTQKEAGHVHIVSQGLDTLTGTWDTIENGPCCVHHAVAGARPAVEFTVGEQGHLALPKAPNGPKFLLTRLTGLGSVSLLDGSTSPSGIFSASGADAIGTIHYHKWRIFEHGVVDEDLLVLKVTRVDGTEYRQDDEIERITEIGVVVTKAAHSETDLCPAGAKGLMSLVEVKSGPHTGKDSVGLAIGRCAVADSFTNGRKGAKVGVGLTLKQP